MQRDDAVLGRERRADAGDRRAEDQRVDRLHGGAGDQRPAGVAKRGARHHGDRHAADRADRPGVHAGRSGARPNADSAVSANRWHKQVGDVEDQHQPVAPRPPAAPARQPRGVREAGGDKRSHERGCGAAIQAAKAKRRASRIAAMSQRSAGAGSAPGFMRASQLRVKLGMMRPPISEISRISAARPMRTP